MAHTVGKHQLTWLLVGVENRYKSQNKISNWATFEVPDCLRLSQPADDAISQMKRLTLSLMMLMLMLMMPIVMVNAMLLHP